MVRPPQRAPTVAAMVDLVRVEWVFTTFLLMAIQPIIPAVRPASSYKIPGANPGFAGCIFPCIYPTPFPEPRNPAASSPSPRNR
jgi:hypothetical protein